MGFLALTRREGEQLRLTIDPGVDIQALTQLLLRDGITIHVGEIRGSQVQIAVDAPPQIQILRSELSHQA